MRRVLSLLIIMSIAFSFCTMAKISEHTTILTVDEDVIIKQADKGLLGYNDDSTWQGGEWRLHNGFTSAASTQVQNPGYYEALQNNMIEIPLIRGFFHNLEWKKTIGEMSERGYDGYGRLLAFGLVEWIKSAQSVTPDAQFVITVNLNDDPENIADLVRFLTLNPQDENAVGTDGINWALRRIELGIPNPVNVACFEMGNETDNSYRQGETLEEWKTNLQIGIDYYVPRARERIEAVKRANPDAKTSVLSYSQPHDGRNVYDMWNKVIIPELGGMADYIVHHYYYHYVGNQGYELHNRFDNMIMKYVDALETENKPKIFLSEHAIWQNPADRSTDNKTLATSLKGVLVTAETINRLCNNPDVGLAAFHCFVATGCTRETYPGHCWGIIREYVGGDSYVSAEGELFKLLNNAFGKDVVKTSFQGVNHNLCVDNSTAASGGSRIITATAHTRDDGGLNVIFNNSNPDVSHKILFNAKNQYKLEKAEILTSDYLQAENNIDTPETIYTQTYLYNEETAFSTYTVPNQSVVVLYLAPMDAEFTERFADVNINRNLITSDYQTIEAKNGKMDIDIDLIANRDMANSKNITVMVAPEGGGFDNVFDLAYFEQKKTIHGGVHFEFDMPEKYTDGNYVLKITNGSSSQYINFVYKKYLESDKITSIVIKNGGYDYINNNSYKAEVCIASETSIAIGTPITVEVKNSDGEIVSVGEVKKEDLFTDYEFYMPIDAISGKYTISAFYTNERNKTEVCEKEFDFVKPNEDLQIISVAETASGEKLTLKNISATNQIAVRYKNISSAYKDCRLILSVYDKTGKLVSTTLGESLGYDVDEEKDYVMDIDVSAENVGAVRLYTWQDMSAVKPHTDYYTVK